MKNFPRELRHGMGATMILDLTHLLLSFKEAEPRAEVERLLKGVGLGLESGDEKQRLNTSSRPMQVINHTDRRFWVRTEGGRTIDDEFFAAIEGALRERVNWIGPVYRLPGVAGLGGLLCPLPNVLIIKPLSQHDADAEGQWLNKLDQWGLHEDSEKSRYLGGYRYYRISNPEQQTAYQLQALLLEQARRLVQEARFENMPILVPTTVAPNDPLFAQQWDMTQIQAGGPGITGWDISTGVAGVTVCVLDTGCDLTHPDLRFSTPGINLGTMMPDGRPTGDHGTACAGIVAARFNNALGPAGVAGNCQVMPVAFQNWTDVECAAGINFAANNGARVISMSFGVYAPGDGSGPTGWDFTIIDPAIVHAVNDRGCVLCAATGNENFAAHNRYPSRHPLVIACGASDRIDNRKSPASPDGEGWGSNFGVDNHAGRTTGVAVVAPGVQIPTTDRQGVDGYNTAAGVAGNYDMTFNGTSSATPHVAGMAGVIRSLYPALTNVQVRNIIERTAQKVGVTAYAEAAGFPNGTRNQQMGYGRINLFRALDFSEVMIRDWPGDTGLEPSNPAGGDFWDFSDIVVRITDDNVFVPSNPAQSSNVERGQTNYIYIRVTNNGPRAARNVIVNARITPYVGLEFVYPTDWTANDATHVRPTSVTANFATIPSGGSVIAKFTISAAQTNDLWGWISSHPWHPCLLASVNSDNDYAFATANLTGGSITPRRNNLAQRNLSVIDVLASATIRFPFIAGNLLNKERSMDILVDRSRLPQGMPLLLTLDDDTLAFPLVDLTPPDVVEPSCGDSGMVFLESARVAAKFGCCQGVLTLVKGSRFDCLPDSKIGKVSVKGGEVIIRDGKRFAEIREQIAIVTMEKQPTQIYPLALQTTIPANAGAGEEYMIKVAQRNQKEETVGGATVVYYVK
ncbi:MAG: serine protease [Blastocatellia bacterium]|jgi:subtilisin family serine protease|nr:serine protease [Blastocatellia bacterium]